ncbi:hypothetical protein L2750_14395 [Shewanella submarina]|uniref:Uncharacterized protein n=1 Tax=Shewanella submarina TaxID=2016376 RepID=A0ABV7G8H1_9GAMM|nr:hypothetical protein [Shewanella submarina]MCL1038320.1 hypothetical protein [Shewanella submarina]
MNAKQTIKAVLIAPWITLVFVAILFIEHLLGAAHGTAQNSMSQIPGAIFIIFMFVFGFVGTAYLIVISVGLPVHWFFLAWGSGTGRFT